MGKWILDINGVEIECEVDLKDLECGILEITPKGIIHHKKRVRK